MLFENDLSNNDDESDVKRVWIAALNQYNSEIAIRKLLNTNIDVDARDNDGQTALMWAVQSSRKSVVGVLLKYDADANAIDNLGDTPLIKAVVNDREDMVNLLLNEDVEVDITNNDGHTALTLAGSNGNMNIVSMLLEKCPLIYSVDNSNIDSSPQELSTRLMNTVSRLGSYNKVLKKIEKNKTKRVKLKQSFMKKMIYKMKQRFLF
jgi:ankyrin repeat protein